MTISYRMIKPGEESPVSSFVINVFNEFVAPLFAEEDVEEFNRFTSAEAIAKRINNGNTLLVAESGDEIVGVIEVRENNHVGWLLVDKRFQKNGVGRELLKRAIAMCKESDNPVNRITVNSSPNAVAVQAGCKDCMISQTSKALELGATTAEIFETVSVAISMGGTLAWSKALVVADYLKERELI